MDYFICPIIYAGLLANHPDSDSLKEEARCLGSSCAWWDPRHKLCFIEMMALR